MASPPGPRGMPFVGVIPQLARDPVGACARFAEYGPVVRLPVFGSQVFLLTHPDHIERVLVRANRNHWKGRLFQRTDFLFGRGLVLNDGEDWQRQRRLVQPAFHHERIRSLVPTLARVIERRGDRWGRACDGGTTIELEAEMMTLTLDLICNAMFSLQLDDAQLDTLAASFGTVLDHLGVRMATFAFPDRIRLPGQRKATRALRSIESLVERMIEEHRADRNDDLLSMLLDARYDDGTAMTPRRLRDEIITILFGGYEATAHSLAWTWYLLAKNPDAAARLREEVATADLSALPYTECVIQESLRLYPPFWEVLRSSYAEDEIGGYTIPANASILLSPYVTQRMPELWPDPGVFRPERFAPGSATHPQYAYFPFGAGPRLCIGRSLALLEMRLVIAILARRFRLRFHDLDAIRVRAKATLRSRRGMQVSLERAT